MLDHCLIRPVIHADLPQVLAWRNHPDVRRFMLTQHEIGMPEHRRWFERVSQDPTRRSLIVQTSQGPIGYVQFSDVADGGVADWGFYACPEAPKGSGRLLGNTALRHAFDDLNLHKVCGQALAINQASIAFHERLGFSREGELRDQKQIQGQYHSLILFGLLAQDWRKQKHPQENSHAKD